MSDETDDDRFCRDFYLTSLMRHMHSDHYNERDRTSYRIRKTRCNNCCLNTLHVDTYITISLHLAVVLLEQDILGAAILVAVVFVGGDWYFHRSIFTTSDCGKIVNHDGDTVLLR